MLSIFSKDQRTWLPAAARYLCSLRLPISSALILASCSSAARIRTMLSSHKAWVSGSFGILLLKNRLAVNHMIDHLLKRLSFSSFHVVWAVPSLKRIFLFLVI